MSAHYSKSKTSPDVSSDLSCSIPTAVGHTFELSFETARSNPDTQNDEAKNQINVDTYQLSKAVRSLPFRTVLTIVAIVLPCVSRFSELHGIQFFRSFTNLPYQPALWSTHERGEKGSANIVPLYRQRTCGCSGRLFERKSVCPD